MFRTLPLAALLVASSALADEGMWTYNGFPTAKVKQKYGFEPTQDWLDHARLASVRLANGCSGSLVSPSGLVMTNHHCVRRCIQQLSTAQRDLAARGYLAAAEKDELRCPDLEVNQLTAITDVTQRLQRATQGLTDKAFNEAQRAEMSKIEKECATSDEVRCDVVTLYRGGQHHLYRYRRFQDVRLAFAPEQAVAFFGGDPDNFNFPRYNLDVAFLRLYDGGKPAKTERYFQWSSQGAQSGELAFVSGHPGATSRLLTVAQLETERDLKLPKRLLYLAELRGYLTQFAARGVEQKRISQATLLGVENALKALKGRHTALLDKRFFESKIAAEKALRAKVDGDPKMKAAYGEAWTGLEKAQQQYRQVYKPLVMLEEGRAFSSELFRIARDLVRLSAELPKPNEERLREYADSKLPTVKQRLFSAAPIYDELEIALLTFSLTQMREELGPDDVVVRRLLGTRSPAQLATQLVRGSKLKDVRARRALFEGGQKALEASTDPMIEFARAVDPDARMARKLYEDGPEAATKRNGELIARALFQVHGTNDYPDATFSLRLSYGQVKGWNENGRDVPPLTTLRGGFDRHTGQEPFALPKSWLAAEPQLNRDTPLNFVTNNDIIGGNSGSPVFNQNAEIIGLVFDGNIHSLGGEYGFDERVNRAVAVHSAGILEALAKIYGAQRLVRELRPEPAASAPGSGGK